MSRRARRNPTSTESGIDFNSVAIGALAMYVLMKNTQTAPSHGAYLPAGAPADEPWMRAVGYKKAPQREITLIRVDPLAENTRAHYFSLDAKRVFQFGLETRIVPFRFVVAMLDGRYNILNGEWMQDGAWRAITQDTIYSWFDGPFQNFIRTGVSAHPGPDNGMIYFGELKPLGFRPASTSSAFQQPEGSGVPNSSASLREGFVVGPKPQMRSQIPNAMLRWK